MIIFFGDKKTPPSAGWSKVDFGMTAAEIRVWIYGSVIFFILVNSASLAFFSANEFFDYSLGGIVVFISSLIAYLLFHELIHLAFFPKEGRVLGVNSWSVFCLCCSAISVKRFRLAIVAPSFVFFIILGFVFLLDRNVFTLNLFLVNIMASGGDFILIFKSRVFDSNKEIWMCLDGVYVKE